MLRTWRAALTGNGGVGWCGGPVYRVGCVTVGEGGTGGKRVWGGGWSCEGSGGGMR